MLPHVRLRLSAHRSPLGLCDLRLGRGLLENRLQLAALGPEKLAEARQENGKLVRLVGSVLQVVEVDRDVHRWALHFEKQQLDLGGSHSVRNGFWHDVPVRGPAPAFARVTERGLHPVCAGVPAYSWMRAKAISGASVRWGDEAAHSGCRCWCARIVPT